MWVFEHALPQGWAIAAPRGAYRSARGGYSWTENPGFGRLAAFGEAARRLTVWIGPTSARLGSDPRNILWIGFSQGAAVAFSAVLQGAAARGIASLAGFLPEETTPLPSGLRVFWAHGRRDEDVPFARAQADVDRLRSQGAHVEFCDANVDHRVGAACLTALRRWLEHLVQPAGGPHDVT